MQVDILLATYNGEKYLANQLFSLQQQTYKKWKLLVKDDGSTDSTQKILKNFASTDDRIILIDNFKEANVGPGVNFLSLTKKSDSDLVMFCDQDDIWFEKKIEILVDFAAQNFDNDTPCLVYCDAYGYSDREGIITIPSISKLHARSLREFLFFNAGYQGCSMLFNRSLCQMASAYRSDNFYMHDNVVSLIAHVFGNVYFLPKALMLYRQHSNNVTGNIAPSTKDRLLQFLFKNKYVLSSRHYYEKLSFYKAYSDSLSIASNTLFKAYLSYPSKNIFGRLFIVIRYGFSIGGYRLPLIIKTIIRKPLG